MDLQSISPKDENGNVNEIGKKIENKIENENANGIGNAIENINVNGIGNAIENDNIDADEIGNENRNENEAKSEYRNEIKTKNENIIGKKSGLFSRSADKIKQIYLDSFASYPVSLVLMVLLALIGAVMIEHDYPKAVEEAILRIAIVLGIMAVPILFSETYFPWQEQTGQWSRRILTLIPGILLSSWCLFLSFRSEAKTVFGIDVDDISEVTARVLVCYAAAFFAFTIYRLYRNSSLAFEDYCFKAFCSFIGTTLVYGLFALGVGLLFLIIRALLFDPGDFWERVEIFLLGAVYYPGILLAVSRMKKENGKFATGIFRFVLTPLLLAAFIIVYCYIIKMIVTQTLPSNEVFKILSFVFAFGLPIQTLTMSLRPDPMGKVASLLPYCFIPFIILQCLCLGLRVSQYGLTQSRYLGILLVIFEVGYTVLYLVKKARHVSGILFYAMVLTILALLAPGINVFSAVTASQGTVLSGLPPKNELMNLKPAAINSYAEAYKEIRRHGGAEGRHFLKRNVPDETGTYLDSYYYDSNDESGSPFARYYVYLDGDLSRVDIEGYKTMTKVRTDESQVDLSHISLYLQNTTRNEEVTTVDLTEFLQGIAQKKISGEEPSVKAPIRLDESRLLYIDSLNVDFTEPSEGSYTFTSVHLSGYLLEK